MKVKLSFHFFVLAMMAILCPNEFLQSEIEKVTITWEPMLCQVGCIKLLDKQFRSIPGVTNVTISQAAGQAELTWDKKSPFSFSLVNIAMRSVGVRSHDIRIKVNGAIQHTTQTVTLVSKPDYSRFEMLSPVTPSRSGQTPQYNTASHTLTGEMRQKFLDAETQNQVAVVEGPMFMPERSSPMQLIVDQVSFSESK